MLIEHAGQNYRDVLAHLVCGRSVRTYLEIGVAHGDTLSRIQCDVAIGIDPAFDIRQNVAAGKKRVHLLRTTSDDAFAGEDLRQFAPQGVDFVFLDGMHLFEFLLRDFYKAESRCRSASLIAIHDCFPINVEMAQRTHDPEARQDKDYADWWTGDVWKLIPILKKYRPDLILKGVNAPPTGLLFVTNLDPCSRVLEKNYLKIVREFASLENNEVNIRDAFSHLEIIATPEISGSDHTLHFAL